MFLKNSNHDVSIFTFYKNEPIISQFIKNKIKVIDINSISENFINSNYDVIFSQHLTTLDYIISKTSIKSKYIFHRLLSAFEPLEAEPVYSNLLSLILPLSQEIKVKTSRSQILPNLVTNNFFSEEKYIKVPKKFVVISNHPPNEILELKKFDDLNIDFIGRKSDKHFYINKDFLLNYDAIISIGRSVLYGLALKMPVYVYDRFGGDGWLNIDNYQKNKNTNFSGRSNSRKISSDTIYSELINQKGYPSLVEVDKMRERVYKTNNFTKIKYILDNLKSHDTVDLFLIRNNYNFVIKYSEIFERYFIQNQLINEKLIHIKRYEAMYNNSKLKHHESLEEYKKLGKEYLSYKKIVENNKIIKLLKKLKVISF